MRASIFVSVLALSAAASAGAEAGSRPFVAVNGKARAAGQGGGWSRPAPAREGSPVPAAAAQPASGREDKWSFGPMRGGRAFRRKLSGDPVRRGGSSGSSGQVQIFGHKLAIDDGRGAPRRAGEEEEAPPRPPHFDKAGALIRSEGLGYKTDLAAAPREQTPGRPAGVAFLDDYYEPDAKYTKDVGRAFGPRTGKADKAPPCTPKQFGCPEFGGGSGGKGGESGITPNVATE